MAESWLKYDRMVEAALRGVVRKALAEAAQRGLPGDHHFYITFHTDRPGVGLADWLRQQYPQEMTIILQHQFWELAVDEERFAVTLSFGGRHERLVIPFSAVTAFADPSVKFGLQFEAGEEQPSTKTPAASPAKPERPAARSPAPASSPPKGADVVALDTFRKK
ncbi:MAG TPA: ClpXP protease specificity-enhancing factor SspB [Dongiaceae bacterium]|nr:ClpXP protease specificity-enhancing factor SspB [Dongiaceae bacterium]